MQLKLLFCTFGSLSVSVPVSVLHFGSLSVLAESEKRGFVRSLRKQVQHSSDLFAHCGLVRREVIFFLVPTRMPLIRVTLLVCALIKLERRRSKKGNRNPNWSESRKTFSIQGNKLDKFLILEFDDIAQWTFFQVFVSSRNI